MMWPLTSSGRSRPSWNAWWIATSQVLPSFRLILSTRLGMHTRNGSKHWKAWFSWHPASRQYERSSVDISRQEVQRSSIPFLSQILTSYWTVFRPPVFEIGESWCEPSKSCDFVLVDIEFLVMFTTLSQIPQFNQRYRTKGGTLRLFSPACRDPRNCWYRLESCSSRPNVQVHHHYCCCHGFG